jgi:hypothetical protein
MRPLHSTRPRRQHHRANEVRVFVHQPAARFEDDPFGAKQKRYCATVADAETDQMRLQFLKIAIRQIRDDHANPSSVVSPRISPFSMSGTRGFA